MSETTWQPIETAPTDRMVRLGKWDLFSGKLEWRESAGAPWERSLFGRRLTYCGREYSHWQPLPGPPTNPKGVESHE